MTGRPSLPSGEQGVQPGHRLAHFLVPSRLEEIADLAGAIRAFLETKATPDQVDAVELGISEAFNNIVLHGRPGAKAGISCSFDQHNSSLLIEIEDQGQPIPEDRLAAAGPHVFDFDETDLASIPEGGMGLAILKMAFDRVSYQTIDGVNRLTLEKRVGQLP